MKLFLRIFAGGVDARVAACATPLLHRDRRTAVHAE